MAKISKGRIERNLFAKGILYSASMHALEREVRPITNPSDANPTTINIIWRRKK
jgi:hypothetical protein